MTHTNLRESIYTFAFWSALDSVWHAGLIYNFHHSGIFSSSKHVKLLHMFHKLQGCVKQDQHVSVGVDI